MNTGTQIEYKFKDKATKCHWFNEAKSELPWNLVKRSFGMHMNIKSQSVKLALLALKSSWLVSLFSLIFEIFLQSGYTVRDTKINMVKNDTICAEAEVTKPNLIDRQITMLFLRYNLSLYDPKIWPCILKSFLPTVTGTH